MDITHENLQLVGVHVPDDNSGPFPDAQSAQAAGYDTLNPVTGTYAIGAMIEGAFVPIISEKASLIYDKINLAKATAAASEPATPPASNGGESAMQTGEQQTPPPADPPPTA